MYSSVLKKVFSNARYLFLALATLVLALSFILLLPNREVIQQIIFSEQVGFWEKLTFVFGMYEIVFTNYNNLSIVYLFSIAILFALNIALLTYYVRRRQLETKSKVIHYTSVSGFVSGLFGIGCAACGSVIITSALTAFGGGSLILLMPFQGAEFGVLGISLLLYSNYYLIKKISDPLICPV